MRQTRCNPLGCFVLAGFIIISIMLYLHTTPYPKLVRKPVLQVKPRDINITHRKYTLEGKHNMCTEKTNIVYIKVPKTGSSTIASVLMRFGLERNLTFAVPLGGDMFSHRPLLPEFIAPIPGGKQYDLLVHHSTYNHSTVEKVFPKGTVIIASVRNPFSNFRSAFHYFGKYKKNKTPAGLKDEERMELFINKSFKAFNNSETVLKNIMPFNRQSFRLAVPLDKLYDVNFVRRYIATELDVNLDFVLVQEYLDESFVLMKRFLCWNLSDILYLPHNVRARPAYVYSKEIMNRHSQLAMSDYMIYDHFVTKFWKAVKQEGLDFFEEVRAFKQIKSQLFSYCFKTPLSSKKLIVPSTTWSEAFEVNSEGCREMQLTVRSRLPPNST